MWAGVSDTGTDVALLEEPSVPAVFSCIVGHGVPDPRGPDQPSF